MDFSVANKSQLAKLMASENLTVVHRKMATAMIDIKSRTIYLPMWKNMSAQLYDLLTGHEVGHALYTPLEGLHGALVDEKKGKNYKSFLNVVEDARIERKIQRKFPGLKSSFSKAYKELIEADFFGIRGRDVNKMPFIDRLNIYTKTQYTGDIQFNDAEQSFVDRIKNIETWDEAVQLADEIYAYSKNEQSNTNQMSLPEMNQDGQDEMPDNTESSGENQEQNDSENTIDTNDFGEKSENADGESEESESEGDGDNDGDGESDEESEKENGKINREKLSAPSKNKDNEDFDPVCETDDAFRENEETLVDEKSVAPIYAKLPTPVMDQLVTPAKVVHHLMSESFQAQMNMGRFNVDQVRQAVNKFKSNNEKYIGMLAKEFEMKKAAKSFSKSKLSDTGDVDINKLASYKFDDNIFRKVMNTPKGKSHGLVLLLDCSGSMTRNMAGSIEQILILTMFCRKVNIPFEVYGFNNSRVVQSYDIRAKKLLIDPNFAPGHSFTQNNDEIYMSGDVSLRQYLHSGMNSKEFNQAFANMVLLREVYVSNGRQFRVDVPGSEILSNTPLIEAIVGTAKIMKDFKVKTKVDLTSLIVVHDGDADGVEYIMTDNKRGEYFNVLRNDVFLTDKANRYFRKIEYTGDIKQRDQQYLRANQVFLENIMHWFKEVTGSKVIGFFLVAPEKNRMQEAIRYRYQYETGKTVYEKAGSGQSWWETVSELVKKIRNDNFLQSHNLGYDDFYLLLGGKEMLTEEDVLESVGDNPSASKLANAFKKMNKKRTVSRVLVNRFIQKIAA
jgi:cobalamin biosynthesis protein CobT